MKQKVYFIGDCHMARIKEHWNPNDCPIDPVIWGKAGFKCFNLSIKKMYESNESSTGTERGSIYFKNSEDTTVEFIEIEDNGIIMPWVGYIDIRQYLPKYKNTDEVVKKYVEEIVNFYKNSTIRFIEPLPQFTEMLLKYEGIHPSYSYDDRQNINKEFVDSLRKYSNLHGLQQPVSQESICDSIGLYKFTTDLTPKDLPHPSDSLEPKYMKKIYNLFVDEALKTI
jgi:hypothetical protein